MEFKFRAGDNRPPPSTSPAVTTVTPSIVSASPLSFSLLSDHALQANCSSDLLFTRSQIEMYTIQRAVEKERIRLEILAAENVRRRLLEEEVRRELMMEREAAQQGSSVTLRSTEARTVELNAIFPSVHNFNNPLLMEEVRRQPMMNQEAGARASNVTGGLSADTSHPIQLNSMLPLLHNFGSRLPDDQPRILDNRSSGFPFGMFSSIYPHLSSAATDKNKSIMETQKLSSVATDRNKSIIGTQKLSNAIPNENKNIMESNMPEKLISLDKPDPNISGVKRKVETPASTSGQLPFTNMKKKPKQEWSCAVCEVKATCEKGLNDHIQGRKHKAKEARMKRQAQKMRSSASLLLEFGKQTEVTVGGDPAKSEQTTHVEDILGQFHKTIGASVEKLVPESQKQDEKLLRNEMNKNDKKANKNQNSPKRKKILKFWCELCQVGVPTQGMMASHEKGKKHLAKKLKGKAAVPTVTNQNARVGDDTRVLKINGTGAESNVAVKEVKVGTIGNGVSVEEEVLKNDAAPNEKAIAVVTRVAEEANKEKEDMILMSDIVKAENVPMVEEVDKQRAENHNKTESENDVAGEANAKTTRDEEMVAEEEAN